MPRLLVGTSAALLWLAVVDARAASCRDEVGARRALDFVRQCRDVAGVSRGLCQDGNSCSVLIGEIQRGCRDLGEDGPNFCGVYGGVESDDEE